MSRFTSIFAGPGTNTTEQTITNRAFVAYEHGIGDPKDPFEEGKIAAQLRQRLNYTSYPSQEETSLCGPAAFFYCLQKSSPTEYERMVWDLWKKGKTTIEDLTIKVPVQTRRPIKYFYSNGSPKISGIDWMTLGGLRGSSNTFLAYNSPDNELSAITARAMMISWFKKAGFALKAKFGSNSIYNHQLINEYTKRNNYYVVSLVDSAIIDNARKVLPDVPNHWIVWSSQLSHLDGRILNDDIRDSDKVKMICFSWGKNDKPLRTNCTYAEFKILHYFCYIFSK